MTFRMRISTFLFAFLILGGLTASAQVRSPEAGVWVSDNGKGSYKNPIIYADYSDPDVIRVGDDYYMTSSSFSHFPGLPILHSRDLINWKIIGHAAPRYPFDEFSEPQHGKAIWAPSIRYHDGEFFIYFGDPDRGVFLTKAKNPAGPWEPLRLIRTVTGWIDPCPLWDDDGNAYLVHAWANSRAGIKSILAVNRMNKDGTEILDDGIVVFVGHFNHPTIEGPKFYKRNGYYYIFAPAGGVKPGWQTVLRSKNVFGPYEDKKVLEQGSTNINGPHQGAWVDTKGGEDWFLHFQDRYAYGRIVHLQPMRWENDWPVIGVDYDKNGIGEPVLSHKKPNVGNTYPVEVPQTSDEFDSSSLGLQWQWEANYESDWVSLDARKGWLRLYSQLPSPKYKNLWTVPNLMLQKMPAPAFSATARFECAQQSVGEKSGLVVFGLDYSYIGICKSKAGYTISHIVCTKADKGTQEETSASVDASGSEIYLRVEVRTESTTEITPKVLCSFSYSIDGRLFHPLGKTFTAREGLWVGAKVGVFASGSDATEKSGYTDLDRFRIERLEN
ncbi:MAG: glycoside hydrolase 43 family protein [Ignavibacteria bacterium]|nr:glycoside hydrolase 43 family protein [Ignavibacteria bacterium]